jgi:hypothetical protein
MRIYIHKLIAYYVTGELFMAHTCQTKMGALFGVSDFLFKFYEILSESLGVGVLQREAIYKSYGSSRLLTQSTIVVPSSVLGPGIRGPCPWEF